MKVTEIFHTWANFLISSAKLVSGTSGCLLDTTFSEKRGLGKDVPKHRLPSFLLRRGLADAPRLGAREHEREAKSLA